jgi:alkanesulfonate monooxygenase SsuD/methylene tetrahydromethanopterin reductase-like flavin-dependent oxidoreductase (luciferase family)
VREPRRIGIGSVSCVVRRARIVAADAVECFIPHTSTDLVWVRRQRGELLPIPSPEEASRHAYSPAERAVVEMNRARHFIGTPATVAGLVGDLVTEVQADEVMVPCMIYGRAERLRTYETLAAEWALRAQDRSAQIGTP